MNSNNDPIYLDHNATTPVLPEVVDAMLPWLRDHFGNPSSTHIYGRRTHDAVERARAEVAMLIGCDPAEIFFTSGGTESNNLAIRGAVSARPQRKHILTSVIEHPATQMPCAYLEQHGYQVGRAPVDSVGMVDIESVNDMLRDDTAVVSIMHANSETGTLQPIREITNAAHGVGALMHTDAAQSVGKVPVDVNELGIDLLSIVGHKMYAPKGIGALYIQKDCSIDPLVLGGGHESGIRPGTENVPYIVGLGKACEIAHQDGRQVAQQIQQRRDQLWGLLQDRVPGIVLNGHVSKRLPNTLNVRFPGVSGNALLDHAPEIAASTGSACHAEDESASDVIRAMGLSEAEALGSVRLTLGRDTSSDDVVLAADALVRAFKTLKSL